jgi:hypothetical protein
VSKVANSTGSVKGAEREIPSVDTPKVDEPEGRLYRAAPVETVALPDSFVEAVGGAFTRKGTPRLELLCAARGAYVQRRSDAAASDVLQFDTGAYAFREEGEHIKSIQSHAEDIWRRVYKRPIPEGNPLDNSGFRTLYDRTRRALKRSDLLEDRGPAVPDPNKRVQDAHGKRWSLSDRLREAESGTESAAPPQLTRCKGEGPDRGASDVWTRVERRVAQESELHREFTHAVTASALDGPRRTAHARRFERRHAREGGDRPRYVTVGRWHPEAVGRSDRRKQAVRVPWIVAEIDGRNESGEKDRAASDRLARRLLRRLDSFGVDLSDVVVSYSGNASIHVRIPDGAVGCPIYRDGRAAKESIQRFFDRLCGSDSELRTAIDDACTRPGQLIRAVGSIHEATGRQTVGTTADRFLEKPAAFLWSLSEPQFQYSPPERYPVPRRAAFVPGLSALLSPPSNPNLDAPETPNSEGSSKTNVQQCVSGERGVSDGAVFALRDRLRGGVGEGEPWGLDVGRPEVVGRNWAALFFSHLVLAEKESREGAWRIVRDWNRRFNAPPLPESELRGVFERAADFQRGYVQR